MRKSGIKSVPLFFDFIRLKTNIKRQNVLKKNKKLDNISKNTLNNKGKSALYCRISTKLMKNGHNNRKINETII